MGFKTVLIANRGEIASRIARSCHALGLTPVGVYSDEDRDAPYLDAMARTHHLPGSTPRETYLNEEAMLEAARQLGAEAVHPGYGFLSENEGFIRRCEESGIVFIGPSADHVSLMGEKRMARDAFASVDFPVVPQYPLVDGTIPADARYPVILKAAAGGGGIGMTLVRSAAEVERAAKRVSGAAERYFGSPDVYAERYLEGARHIEIQVIADGRKAVQVGERDCSWQRRYQKVVEESPAPGLPRELVDRLASAAAEAVQRLGYTSVGTVECLVLGDEFFFLEMNTRIQVEHGITELVHGIDLVEWQLRIAAGEELPASFATKPSGHAVEFRLYAEDPATLLPSPGTITDVSFPNGGGIRVDSGVRAGSRLSTHYDPLIAKIMVHGQDRAAALSLARQALAETRIEGVKTNLPLLQTILDSEPFVAGKYHTQSLDKLRAAAAPKA